MTDSQKLSRRDWFRLRLPKADVETENDTRAPSVGQTAPGLQPIANPVNHDGLDLSELPPMREALLSKEDVSQLFADIESLATDILLMQRASKNAQAKASRATTSEELVSAKQALLSSAVPRLQIRYRWQDGAWIDTLESRPDGFRLVRINHAW